MEKDFTDHSKPWSPRKQDDSYAKLSRRLNNMPITVQLSSAQSAVGGGTEYSVVAKALYGSPPDAQSVLGSEKYRVLMQQHSAQLKPGGIVLLDGPPKATGIDQTLAERGSRYGSFVGHARITQRLKSTMMATDNWQKLADDQREALEMIALKIGRILNGDPNYHDSWHDIVGYTKLVADRLLTGGTG